MNKLIEELEAWQEHSPVFTTERYYKEFLEILSRHTAQSESLESLASRKGYPKVYYECAVYGAQDDMADVGFGGGTPQEAESKARAYLDGLPDKKGDK